MATATDQAAAQAEQSVHTAATAGLTALTKLAAALKAAGADADTVKQVDDMSNALNDITSSVVGNPPADTAAPAAPPPEAPDAGAEAPGDLTSAIQGFHNDQVTAAGGQPRY